jgi:phage regulator Rha-like protein
MLLELLLKPANINSGTYAHRNIALEFCSWLSPEFKLYLIQEFERLKKEESEAKNLDWDMSRFLASIKYRIQTDSIKENIIPKLNIQKESLVYASEADLLNLALFGKTAKKWREENPELAKSGNN